MADSIFDLGITVESMDRVLRHLNQVPCAEPAHLLKKGVLASIPAPALLGAKGGILILLHDNNTYNNRIYEYLPALPNADTT